MRFDKYTIKAQEAIGRTQELARQKDHAEMLPLHLLAALLAEDEGVVRPLLQKLGANADRIAGSSTVNRPSSQATGHVVGARSFRTSSPRPKEADSWNEYVPPSTPRLAKVKKGEEILTVNSVDHGDPRRPQDIRADRITDQNPREKYQRPALRPSI
jgi:ATP-dependent Clp protease ATP-binding subunit ClpB